MARFLVRRSLSAVALLFAVSVVVFGIFEIIPSYNPARAIAGRNANATTVHEVAHKFGFDQPVYVQYVNTMKLIFSGQIIDYQNDLNVVDQFRQRFPATLSLVIPAAIFWMFAAIVLGSISALKAGKLADRALMVLAILGVSIPIFLLAAVLLYLLAFKTTIFPNTGYAGISDPVQWAYHLILPWLSIAVLSMGFYSRVLRSNSLDMINQDFVRTARAKGLYRAAGVQPPRAAQLADADRHHVRAGLRHAARRCRAGHRDRVQPPRHRPVRGYRRSATSTCRRLWWARCSPPSSSFCSAPPPTWCMPSSTPAFASPADG